MLAGFTKYCCFLCLWESRAVSQHYMQKDRGSRSTFVPGEQSLKENTLVDMNKVLLPPLHIKLGLMKNFVKALHKNGAAFQHLSTVFPGLSADKLKEGIFIGPHIREVPKDTDFEELLNLKKLGEWEAFKSVCSGFLGNTRLPDYQACIEKSQIKANGIPAWWETSAGCSCVTSRRQNTPDLLRKYTFYCLWYYELCNCVIQVYWFNQCSLSILFYPL